MLKYTTLLFFITLCSVVSAQKINGRITDNLSGIPLSSVLVSSSVATVATNVNGEFEVQIKGFTDTIKLRHLGYKTTIIPVSKIQYPFHIPMEQSITALNTVSITAYRDYRKDSLLNRRLFAKEFNYTEPKLKSMFLGNAAERRQGEFISIDVLQLLSLLTKKNSAEYKLHRDVVLDEQAAYVSRKWTRTFVAQNTGLKNDSLTAFLSQYRPTYQYIIKTSEYELIGYIRQSLQKFRLYGIAANPFDTTLYKSKH